MCPCWPVLVTIQGVLQWRGTRFCSGTIILFSLHLTSWFHCFRSWDFSPTVCWRHPVVHFSFRWRPDCSPQFSRILPSVTPFNGSVTMALLWIVANQNHFCLVHLATFVIFPQYLVQILLALWYLYLTKSLLSGLLSTVTWHLVITPQCFQGCLLSYTHSLPHQTFTYWRHGYHSGCLNDSLTFRLRKLYCSRSHKR